ncbi:MULTISPECIES: isochorismatase family protein [unclassified Streptomyces]|uniref:isochorismatase family protein n=1 Tax=unclassified Streptomyces TaxID=2593676 RepID=UPI002E2BADC0|nr:isochorismatase family protein [Streptomyces sp. NBC_01423]WSX93085.1 isochorismatase family protein [Streptomyces sp. NBC_00891]WSY07562.1 isochorismatase family protein [Streptomyces sp. NBC_00890]WSZ09188.1 isochorismatase family protein [Streptomyces sp. NBC_00869]WSZ23313.1 isochorismatase family protein [Streptomyces sp. NBC_00870]
MTATVLDPNTALIVVDLQKGITALPTAHPSAGVIANAATLADAFRAKDLPVVLVRVTGGAPGRNEGPARSGKPAADWAEIVPEMGPREGDIVVTKQQWGAFYGTDLDLQLRRRGVTQVVVAGIATSIGVESTARSAHEHGYHVTLATDAMTDMSGEAHDNSVQRIFPRLGETGTTDEIVKLLG